MERDMESRSIETYRDWINGCNEWGEYKAVQRLNFYRAHVAVMGYRDQGAANQNDVQYRSLKNASFLYKIYMSLKILFNFFDRKRFISSYM